MSMNRITIYNQAPKYHSYASGGGQGRQPFPTSGYPYCQFCCEKKKIKAELGTLTSVLDGAGKQSFIPRTYLQSEGMKKIGVSASYPLPSIQVPPAHKIMPTRYSNHMGHDGFQSPAEFAKLRQTSRATPISEFYKPDVISSMELGGKSYISHRSKLLMEGDPEYIKRQMKGSRYNKRNPLKKDWMKSIERPLYWPSDRLMTERETRHERNVFDGVPTSFILNCRCSKRKIYANEDTNENRVHSPCRITERGDNSIFGRNRLLPPIHVDKKQKEALLVVV